jgi:hypothetical protein
MEASFPPYPHMWTTQTRMISTALLLFPHCFSNASSKSRRGVAALNSYPQSRKLFANKGIAKTQAT